MITPILHQYYLSVLTYHYVCQYYIVITGHD